MKIGIESKQDAKKEIEQQAQLKTAGFWQCCALGVGIAAGGISTSGWQSVLIPGMWEGLISTFVASVGFFMVDLSLAELVGIVPFAGGSFGFVRCSLGPFWGFMTACAEMVHYMIYTVRTIQKIAQLVTIVAHSAQTLEPVWALLAYGVITCLHIRGGNLFWNTMIGCTIFTFLILGVYIIGSLTVVDIEQYALNGGQSNGFHDKESDQYARYVHLPMWFYMGICALPLTGQRVKEAHVNIPRAIVVCLIIMAIISIFCLFCVACQHPGINFGVGRSSFALQYGFKNALDAPFEVSAILLFIPTFASATGFMFAAKHQLAAMADSGLMPEIFRQRFGPNKVPVYSVLSCALLQYSLYLIINHYLIHNIPATFRLCCVAACLVYIMVMVAFITFRYKFASMKRHFVSPVGIPGAVLGIAVFLQILVGLIFFQNGNRATWIALLIFLVLMMVYYFAYVQYVQFFSKEEQDKFMKAYIMNANNKRKTSKWVKMMTAFCAATGLDKIALRTSRRGKMNNSSMSSKSSHVAFTDRSSKASSAPTTPKSIMSVSKNKVGVEPIAMGTSGSAKSSKCRGPGLRPSLTWSGKHFNGNEDSRKAFQLLHNVDIPEETEEGKDETESGISPGQVESMANDANNDILVADLLVEHFPQHFIEPEEHVESTSSQKGSTEQQVNDMEMGVVASKEDGDVRSAQATD